MKVYDIAQLMLVGILMAGCSQPDAGSVFEKAQNRIGDSLLITKIYTKAECEGPDGPFYTQIWSGKEGFLRFEQRSSWDTTIAGVNDSGGWMVNDDEVADIKLANEVFLHGHELHFIAFDPLSRFTNPIYSGNAIFDGQQVIKIQFQDMLNNPVSIYYEPSESYPIGMVIRNPFNEAGEIQILFKDWKQLDNGLFFFTRASFLQGGQVWRYNYTTIDINNFGDTIFHP